MNVDRSRFLLLTVSIAAACSSAAPQPASEPITVAPPMDIEPSGGDEPEPAEPLVAPQPLATFRAGTDGDLVAACRAIKPPPGPHCESFSDTKSLCETFAGGLEVEAAERATGCLTSRSGTEAICRFEAIEECFLSGISGYRSEPRHASECRPVVQRCSGYRWANRDLTMASCTSAVAAVKDGMESRMIGCIAEGCGIGSCVWDLSNR